MRFNQIKTTLKAAVSAATVLLLGGCLALAQQQVNLTAGPTSINLPDGTNVPMWGYTCGAPVSGSTATCRPSNPAASGWSPVVITVPTGQSLTINLTNNLQFAGGKIPTSLMIVGQVGGGLGSGGTTVASPLHPTQQVTWPTANTGDVWMPPAQGPRVQSFGTEVAVGTPQSLTWTTPRAGTYLLESGTHPSVQGNMGLYGVLVVTSAPTASGGIETGVGTAYPGINYDAEVPLVFSEIDPAQNNAVSAAVNTVGFSETASRGPSVSGSVLSVTLTNGGKNYTSAPSVSFAGGGGSGATATAVIDTVSTSPTFGQVTEIDVSSGGTGYTSAPTIILSGGGGTGGAALSDLARSSNSVATCTNSDGTIATACYPPTVNYTPLYYLINGVAFNRTNASASLFPVSPATIPTSPISSATGNVLFRLVNAGSRMHVPTIVGSQAQQLASGTAVTVGGLQLIAEDGNLLPGIPHVQSEVFMAAGKTYDVMINVPASGGLALPVYDRELSLSGNATERDAGMLAYVGINGAGLPSAGSLGAAKANADTYNSVVPCTTAPCAQVTVSDTGKGVIANDVNVYAVQLQSPSASALGTLTLASNGTFTYVPNAGAWTASSADTFTYCGNGATSGLACNTITLNAASIEAAGGITLPNSSFTSKMATFIKVPPSGVLAGATDAVGYPLSVAVSTVTPSGSGWSVNMDPNGGFSASVPAAGVYTFTFQAQNSQGTLSAATATVTLTFPQGSGLSVSVVDGKSGAAVTDYRWIIEEDKSFYISPNCTSNPPPAGCIQTASGTVPLLGTNFHTSDMTYVAQGCTGPLSCESGQTLLGQPAVCDIGNGACRADTTGNGKTAVDPKFVVLDPSKRYYISALPGDAANPFTSGNASSTCSSYTTSQGQTASTCGHSMGGAPILVACTGGPTCTGTFPPVKVLVEQDPFPPSDLAVNVFEDDFPLNGEQDSGGGIDVLATNEPGLGGFNILLWDDMGGSGDVTGQMTYDMFNQPLSNSLDGYIDPATGFNACPITLAGNTTQTGITGMIVTCPKYESDGATLSPLAGEAVVKNLMPGRFSVQAIPGADRIAKGEEWLQTNTLDGQKAHDSFLRIGEPDYFQEFGPANYHVNIGFANPKIINGRLAGVCGGTDPNAPTAGQKYACTSSITGKVTTERMSRTPDERLYSSGSRDSFYFTQCYVSIGDPDGEDFAFTKCNSDGTFTLSGLPEGSWRLTTFDQWNDQLVDGLSFPIALQVGATLPFGDVPANQWQANVYTRTFIDDNEDGISQATEGGIPFINTTVRYRDGSLSNNLVTDLTGTANFNEEFPLFNWYVVETDTTRYKTTGIHTVYDAGGPADGTVSCGQTSPGYPLCGTSTAYNFLANTAEQNPLPADLSVPGSVYCLTADCANQTIQSGAIPSGPGVSTGRIDPPWLGGTEGWQGYSGQNNFIEFGKAPYSPGENGGIKGHVIYASTRPFDDPQMLVQTQWEPLVPHVTINLYQEGTAADGITPTLTLVDHTQTSSFDDFAQGFRLDASGNPLVVDGHYVPNMNCPGQSTGDPFYFSLENQPFYLDYYNNVEHTGGTGSATALPYNSQYKCYDGMHNWNQVQPVPYDGMYSFPSVSARDANGKPTATNCSSTACTTDPASDEYAGIPMLKPGKYVVEVVPPQGYEIVKEEDKNILIGDNFIAPVTQEFGGLGDIFIIPDQAQVGSAYNPNNAQNSTQSLGASPNNGIVPGFTPEPTWPCVGQSRVVPDYISLFPQSQQVAPFAGATRNLCDRKEVTLSDQAGAIAKFYIYTSTHKAAKFTGVITDDFTSEFDPFSPQFGEKFAPPNMPIAIKDWTGAEISRVYSDWWGDYDGLTYSTWEVNPPNPTGYSPTMMIFCMNDKGTGTTPDPLYNPGYSQFCYELPYMPGQTDYLDTPVVPTSAFSAGYNHPDCNYPASTPAVSEVDGTGKGPWVGTSVALASLTLGANGSGYTSVPSVTIAGGGGSGATAKDSLEVVNITRGNVGHYSSAPTAVVIAAPPAGGTLATATATWTRHTGPTYYSLNTIRVTNAGSGYTGVPAISFTGGGTVTTTATATAVMGVGNVTLTASGTGYTSAPTVNISGGGGSGATATAVIGSMATSPLMITALGDQQVINNAYSGPTATAAPFNNQFITRHYGFGGTQGTVTIGGVPATVTSWTDGSITATVPALGAPNGVPLCAVQQQAQYFGNNPVTPAYCGQLVITTASGQQSVDTVTVTIGGKPPTYVNPALGPLTPTGTGAIQQAIDAAAPGDLIMVPAGNYQEMVMMWKPVRLQGVAAASSIIDANAQPAGKMDPWRVQLGCLFGLDQKGYPLASFQSCASWNYFTPASSPQVDRLPLEGIVGWDTTTNGNLAQLLSEPTLMGAYEGAAVTVVGKGVNAGPGDYFGTGNEAAFPTGSVVLTANDCGGLGAQGTTKNPYPSNFQCNPSSIDGLTLTDASEGGGGIFVHAWAHNLQIANNRVFGNIGTLSGGINVGQGESPDAYLAGTDLDTDPASCESSNITNTQLPYCFDLNVNVHNNSVTSNTSIGDELFSGTPAGAGGVSFCTGADYYKFNYNWVCGNMSTGDGGGVAHIGFNKNGDIEHNTIIFNQSLNPTIPTNGGGLIVMATAPDGTLPGSTGGTVECGSITDVDCAPGLGDGTGPGLVINANLIMGNAAEAGSGGGIRFQGVNGTDIPRFPTQPQYWYGVTVTNNIITNNVAGWDGGGVSLQDSLVVNMINNTIASNDSTATAGVLFNTLGAPLASAPGASGSPGAVNQTNGLNSSAPQPAGIVSMANSTNLTAALPGAKSADYGITCPANHTNCGLFSNPYLANNVIWQNRTFFIGVGTQQDPAFQQNLVTLYNSVFTGGVPTPSPGGKIANQATTGQCVTGANYWDIGVRGDTGPGNHSSGYTLAPTYSVLTNPAENGTGTNILNANPNLAMQYCNGSRTPPEFAKGSFNVPPGISDATVPNPIFNLSPAATVDEGNNWINLTWGPLTLVNPTTQTPTSNTLLGNYALASGSPAIDYVPTSSAAGAAAPSTDFYGKPRPDPSVPNKIDIGAIEYQGSSTTGPYVAPTSLDFGSVALGGTSATQTLTLTNPTATGLTGITVTVTAPYSRLGGTCSTTLAAGANCTITLVFSPTSPANLTNPYPAGTVTITAGVAVDGSPVALTGEAIVPTFTASITPTSLVFGGQLDGTTSAAQTLTVTNTGNSTLSAPTLTFTAGFARSTTSPGTCAATLTVATGTCTINVVFTPSLTANGPVTGNLTVAYADTGIPATVTPSSVPLSGTAELPTHLASVTPSPLAFGNWATGTTSPTENLTVTNTGNTALAGGTFTLGGGTPQPFTRVTTGTFPAGAPNCGAALAVSASCTIKVQFAPTGTAASYSRTLIVAYTGATVTPTPVTLTGTGVATRATVSISPNPLTITLPTGTLSGSGTVTLTNTAAAGGSNVSVTNVSAAGSGLIWAWTKGTDACTGSTLAPGASCTVQATFTRLGSAGTHTGSITFTDTGAGSPQSGVLTGVAH